MKMPVVGPAIRFVKERVQAPRPSEFESPGVGECPDGDFAELFVRHTGRLAHKWIHYFSIYDELLRDYRAGITRSDGSHGPIRFLEIGVSHGGSLEIWREYFGNDAIIVGIDIDPRCADPTREDLDVRIGSQDDEDFLRRVVADMGGVDVVLDDGSHVARHQRASFDVLFPLLAEGGLYLVEDLHTSYWFGHGGGYRRPGTFVEVAKGLVDGMHGWYFRYPLRRRPRAAMTDVSSIQFFDSFVAIRKARRSRPQVMQVGTPVF